MSETLRTPTTTKKRKSRVPIPDIVQMRLVANCAGRCQYDGCPEYLLQDGLTKKVLNASYIAHIVAAEPDGPRGDEIKSPLLAKEYDNLMLLCDVHHRLVDRVDVAGHPVELLTKMKKDQEARVRLVTGITANRNSHILLYGANIGLQNPLLNYNTAADTILPGMFPATDRPLSLSLENSTFKDHEADYWIFQEKNLIQRFNSIVQPVIEQDPKAHFSVFALAPMPLLIRLGTLLSDIYPASVFQKHREPDTWRWQKDEPPTFELIPPTEIKTNAVLKISLSADITDDRVQSVMGDDTSIWTLTIDNPHNDFMKSEVTLQLFRQIIRKAFNAIKSAHGQNAVLNVFPAMPISSAIEFGRVWMPKADMSLTIYDQNKTENTFIKTIHIK